MSKVKILTGQVFGQLTVIERTERPETNKKSTKAFWLCKCTCGNTKIANTNELISGKVYRCAECGKKASSNAKKKDLTGQRFGHVVVQKMIYGGNAHTHTKCLCKCDCGNTYTTSYSHLIGRSSEYTSCGCFKRESVIKHCSKDINSKRFGRLIVLDTLWDTIPPKVRCQCDCGKIVILNKNDVQSGHTLSCGCLQAERASYSNTKDWSGIKSDHGVEAISQAYKNNKGQWIWNFKCPICGNIFQALPAKVFDETTTSCGCARQSSGEQLVQYILDNDIISKDKSITYKSQYTFDDCRDVNVLRFDYAIFKNNSLLFLLEYNGKQHYAPIDYFGGIEGFQKTHYRDAIKFNYCIGNLIPLIVLPYTMTDEEIKNEIINTIYP